MEAHIVSQVIGDTFFPLAVFLEQHDANEYRYEREDQGGSYVIHTRPLHTGGWYLH